MPYGKALQLDPQLIRADQARAEDRRDVKLVRLPGWNLVRAECSRLCMYAFVKGG